MKPTRAGRITTSAPHRSTSTVLRPATLAIAAVAAAFLLAGCRGGRPAGVDSSRAATATGTRQGTHQLVIGRLLVDPRAVADERGEWVELRNTGADTAELRGWSLRSANDAGFRVTRSLKVAPGGGVVLARDPDAGSNGGVHATLRLSGISLANGGDWLALVDPSGMTADSIAWRGSRPGEVMSGSDARPSAVTAPTAPTAPGTVTAAARDQQPAAAPVRAPLTVRVLDVGQGDAILITNGDSRVLIDGGPDPARLGRLLDSLDLRGRTIDVVILTHQHYDHHGGLRALFDSRRRIAVRYFFENRDPYANAALARLRDSVGARARRGEVVLRDTDDPCADGRPTCTITLRGGALLHVMRPYPQASDANDRSAAVKLVGPDSASFTMWLAGDAERAAIDWFVSEGYGRRPGMDVDVLKLDHHGSCDGLTGRYLDLTTPDWAVASLAAHNDYGYIHSQTTALLRRRGVPWYRTDANGTITITSPGTAGGGYTITPSRGDSSAGGPMDRRASQQACRTM